VWPETEMPGRPTHNTPQRTLRWACPNKLYFGTRKRPFFHAGYGRFIGLRSNRIDRRSSTFFDLAQISPPPMRRVPKDRKAPRAREAPMDRKCIFKMISSARRDGANSRLSDTSTIRQSFSDRQDGAAA
jgi:hypothetical protein